MSTPSESGKTLVTLILGDGIGPEVSGSARRIVDATGAPIEWEEREAGAEVFKRGLPSGVPQDTIDSINRSRVVLKGPLETPVGFVLSSSAADEAEPQAWHRAVGFEECGFVARLNHDEVGEVFFRQDT